MKDISFHITDITQNSVRAGAKRIDVELLQKNDVLSFVITDDGIGMSAETIARITDPFYTTRTTRKVGLGVPFLVQNAEQCGGSVHINSTIGQGTRVEAEFVLSNIDCPPLGNLASTLMMLLIGNPDIETTIHFQHDAKKFSISTSDLREAAGDIPIAHPTVANLLERILQDHLDTVFDFN